MAAAFATFGTHLPTSATLGPVASQARPLHTTQGTTHRAWTSAGASSIAAAVFASTGFKLLRRRASSCCRSTGPNVVPQEIAAPVYVNGTRSPNPYRQFIAIEERTTSRPDAEWMELESGPVRVHPAPSVVVHFIGAAVVGAAPLLAYRSFLEKIAEEASAIVIATPFSVSLDHLSVAAEAEKRFDTAIVELRKRGVETRGLPVFGMGHSTGAVASLLLTQRRKWTGCVLLAVAPQPDLNLPLPQLPEQAKPLTSLLREGAKTILGGDVVLKGLQAALAAAETVAKAMGSELALLPLKPTNQAVTEAARLITQAAPAIGELADGERCFRPARHELSKLMKDAGSPARMMLVKFGNDTWDETDWVLSTFGCVPQPPEDPLDTWDPLEELLQQQAEAEAAEYEEEYGESLDDALDQVPFLEKAFEWNEVPETPPAERIVELVRFPGSHQMLMEPLPSRIGPLTPSQDDQKKNQEQIERVSGAVCRFLRGERAPRSMALVNSGSFALKCHLLRLTAGTDRGFGNVPAERRKQITTCVQDLEAMAPLSNVAEVEEPQIPNSLFGNWRLIWSTSPNVLFLGSLPGVNCGEIRQDIPKPEPEVDSAAIEVLNTVELSVSGGLLSALPLSLGSIGCKAVVRAKAVPRWGGGLSLHFVGADLRPLVESAVFANGVQTPQLDALEEDGSLSLVNTFIDDELRIARSPRGDIFVLLRVP